MITHFDIHLQITDGTFKIAADETPLHVTGSIEWTPERGHPVTGDWEPEYIMVFDVSAEFYTETLNPTTTQKIEDNLNHIAHEILEHCLELAG